MSKKTVKIPNSAIKEFVRESVDPKGIRSIVIIGRRWFDRVNGNTYHTVQAVIDGVCVFSSEMQYGYGEQYQQTAFDWLEKEGYVDRMPHEARWQWKDRVGVNLSYSVSDVGRKKDL